jgi:hypothetical protein
MKKITTFLFLFYSFCLSAQDTRTIEFALDTLRIDSFFLIETTTFQAANAQRPVVTETPVYFSDTTAFNNYIEAKGQRLVDLERQKDQIGVEWQEVAEQVLAMENLRDSVFRGETGFGFLRQSQPAPGFFNLSTFSKPNATSWLIYESPKGAKYGTFFEPFNPDLPAKFDGYVLKPDGTFERIRKNQKKKK